MEDRLLPLLPKLQRDASMGTANGEAGPSSPMPGSGERPAMPEVTSI